MKKRYLTIIIGLVILINLIVVLFVLPISPLKNKEKDVLYIALAAPMSGTNKENGEAMLRGVRFGLEHIYKTGSLKHKKIELLILDDRDKSAAIKIASDIANENKVLLVIGHFLSENSDVAGSIYKKSGIPAITASATADTLIEDNEWYFRIIPGNRFIVRFIANYIKKEMKVSSASIIYDNNDYGLSLAKTFESETKKLGIDIKYKWVLDKDNNQQEQQLKNIIGQLKSAMDRGIIFCGTASESAAAIFASLKYPGTDYIVIGPDTFSTPGFIQHFNNYPKEQLNPGYFSDGITAVSPFLSYIADQKEVYEFRKAYITRYNREPSWIGACYYDAILTAAKGIELAGIHGDNIREDRKRLKEALYRINSREVAVKGATGDIYFDETGNVSKPLAVGFWRNQKFLPAFIQYQDISGSSAANSPDNIIQINDRVMQRMQVVHAGIDINEIRNVDINRGTFTADFYVWFHFLGDFNTADVEFINAVKPIQLEQPILNKRKHNISIRTYRVISDFKINYNTYAYPFDSQMLNIRFRHSKHTRSDLMFVPDILGLSQSDDQKDIEKTLSKPIPGWKVNFILSYQNVINVLDSAKKASSYSQFNTRIQIQRKHPAALLVKVIFPIIILLILLYLIFFMSLAQPAIHASIIGLTFLITVSIHLLSPDLPPGYGVIKYVFFTVYGLCVITAFITILANTYYKRGDFDQIRFLTRAGKMIYPFLTLAACILIALTT